MTLWTLVVPVKGTANSKSRLGGSPAWRTSIARAMALDAVEAALAAPNVHRVIVVTAEAWAAAFAELGAEVLVEGGRAGVLPAGARTGLSAFVEGAHTGLGAAVEAGIRAAGEGPVAVMLGDVPALRPTELADALALAEAVDRAMVADREGSGTVLIAASSGLHDAAFGAGSASAHEARGYSNLAIPEASGLRNDVDTREQLTAVASRVGARTAELLASE